MHWLVADRKIAFFILKHVCYYYCISLQIRKIYYYQSSESCTYEPCCIVFYLKKNFMQYRQEKVSDVNLNQVEFIDI